VEERAAEKGRWSGGNGDNIGKVVARDMSAEVAVGTGCA